VIIGLLTLSLLAGGVANSVHASDNAHNFDENEPICDQSGITSQTENFCVDIKKLRDSEIAAAVSYCRTHAPVTLLYCIFFMHEFINVFINIHS